MKAMVVDLESSSHSLTAWKHQTGFAIVGALIDAYPPSREPNFQDVDHLFCGKYH